MRQQRFGPLDAVVTGGRDRQGGGDGPVVVLLHGFGAPGDDLVGLWRALDVPAEVRFVFPAAPLELAGAFGDARAWWPIDVEALQAELAAGRAALRATQTPEGLHEAGAALDRALDEITATLAPPPGRLVLGGFSQGAMLACDTALRTERPLAGLVLLSGTLLSAAAWTARAPSRAGLPVFQSHGTRDPLLPFAGAESLRDLLRTAGLAHEWHPFPGAHEIPFPILERLGTFLTRVLSPAVG